MLLHINAF